MELLAGRLTVQGVGGQGRCRNRKQRQKVGNWKVKLRSRYLQPTWAFVFDGLFICSQLQNTHKKKKKEKRAKKRKTKSNTEEKKEGNNSNNFAKQYDNGTAIVCVFLFIYFPIVVVVVVVVPAIVVSCVTASTLKARSALRLAANSQMAEML